MKITPSQLNDNIFEMISDRWMLITAGDKRKANTMTASFGGFGVLFFKNVAHIYVRPERHTYEFLEKKDTFSLSFFSPEFKASLHTAEKYRAGMRTKLPGAVFMFCTAQTKHRILMKHR